MKKNQLEAIKKLESALLVVKRAGLMLVGIDNSILYTVIDAELTVESRARSAVEAILSRANDDHPSTGSVNHSGAYRDSGGA